jgi:hypothetical protein
MKTLEDLEDAVNLMAGNSDAIILNREDPDLVCIAAVVRRRARR